MNSQPAPATNRKLPGVLLAYGGRKMLSGVLLLLGVTLISFVLMVYFGPDQSYLLAGKNPTEHQLDEIRAQLGYQQSFAVRYLHYIGQLISLDLGHSNSSGEAVTHLLQRSIPVSIALMLPGFVLGNLLAIGLAMLAAIARGSALDRVIMAASVVGMSTSFLIIIIGCQVVFSSSYGFGWFPVRGWNVHSLADYLRFVSLPTIAIVAVSLGYNTRFYRAVLVTEMNQDYVRTARAYGLAPSHIYLRLVLKNCMIALSTRILFSIPLVVVSGSLLIESYFGIPGVGKLTFDAITSGDQPILKAVVALTSIMLVVANMLADIIFKLLDPRVDLR